MYGHGATSRRSGANRPTASAPALAPSAVRHHASQVRSAAIDVRRVWSRSATSSVSLRSEPGGCGCAMVASNTVRPTRGAARFLTYTSWVTRLRSYWRWLGYRLRLSQPGRVLFTVALLV